MSTSWTEVKTVNMNSIPILCNTVDINWTIIYEKSIHWKFWWSRRVYEGSR